ncbi:hypothetical protein GCM10027167_36470 [Nocardia heshunensis]
MEGDLRVGTQVRAGSQQSRHPVFGVGRDPEIEQHGQPCQAEQSDEEPPETHSLHPNREEGCYRWSRYDTGRSRTGEMEMKGEWTGPVGCLTGRRYEPVGPDTLM